METHPNNEEPIKGFFEEYRWLSNFWMAPITVIGITYFNSESAYQAGKTLDLDERKRFCNLTGAEAKKLGKTITLRPDWDLAKVEVMELCLRAKFMTHKDLADKLLKTGNRQLIEFNYWGDTYWGVTKNGGQNVLGKLLMNIREDMNK